jgi:hypothetical protein
MRSPAVSTRRVSALGVAASSWKAAPSTSLPDALMTARSASTVDDRRLARSIRPHQAEDLPRFALKVTSPTATGPSYSFPISRATIIARLHSRRVMDALSPSPHTRLSERGGAAMANAGRMRNAMTASDMGVKCLDGGPGPPDYLLPGGGEGGGGLPPRANQSGRSPSATIGTPGCYLTGHG